MGAHESMEHAEHAEHASTSNRKIALLIAIIALFLALSETLGKGAQIPVGGWLARAMEGPSPSSAIFYGALSVHLSPYLLLRVSPLIHRSWLLSGLVIAIGLETFSFLTAVRESRPLKGDASWWRFIRNSRSPELPVVLLLRFRA